MRLRVVVEHRNSKRGLAACPYPVGVLLEPPHRLHGLGQGLEDLACLWQMLALIGVPQQGELRTPRMFGTWDMLPG